MSKTRLDLLLDQVESGDREVTIDTDGYTKEQVDRIIATAKERGLHAAYDGRFVLVRDLAAVAPRYGQKRRSRRSRGPDARGSTSRDGEAAGKVTKPQRQGIEDVATYGYVRPKGTWPQHGAAASRLTGQLIRMGVVERIPGTARWKLTRAGEVARAAQDGGRNATGS